MRIVRARIAVITKQRLERKIPDRVWDLAHRPIPSDWEPWHPPRFKKRLFPWLHYSPWKNLD